MPETSTFGQIRPSASHANAFDALRLVLAIMVVYSHAHLVGGFASDPWIGFTKDQMSAGRLGVLGFFGISGYLISASYDRSRTPWAYLNRRVRRIFPAFYASLVVSAFVIGPLIFALKPGGRLADYPLTGSGGALQYIYANAFLHMRSWGIAGMLDGLPFFGSLNGSLWTLFPEFVCYLGVLAVGVCTALPQRRIFLLLWAAIAFGFNFALAAVPGATYPLLPTFVALSDTAPFICAFAAGACCWAFRDEISVGPGPTLLVGMSALVLLHYGGWMIAGPVLFPVFVLSLAQSFELRLRHDFSYGVYIYHFPCQQLLARTGIVHGSYAVFFLSSLALTFAFAIPSWFLVERPFLQPRQPAGP